MTKKGKKKFSVVNSDDVVVEKPFVTVFVLKNVLGYRYGSVARFEDSVFIRDNIRAGNLRLVEESGAVIADADDEPAAIVEQAVDVDDGGDADV